MSNCSDCYTGCSEITSDRCVKYTGVNVPVLGIVKGDSLSYVEQALITFLTSTLNGSGIKIEINEELYCEVVSQYLQECSTVTALDLFKALVQAACSIQEQIDTINNNVAALNPGYSVECLEGVTGESTTAQVLQAVIIKLCEIDTTLTQLAIDVDTNYVKLSDLNDLIQSYLQSSEVADKVSNKMVPYTILPYYGSLSNFDATGAGLNDWEDVYLCNGLNGTPDLRGRSIIGAIVGVPGGAMSATVNPASDPTFNTNYALGTLYGDNKITLSTSQIPSHNHTLTTEGLHTHTVTALATTDSGVGSLTGGLANSAGDGSATTSSSGSHTHTIGQTGGGAPHANVHPVLATYFIIYIP
jgi:microcystin-dependent protein